MSAVEPSRPTGEGVTSASVDTTVTVAVRDSDLGDVDHGSDVQRYRKMGFDLDGVCTGFADAGASCIEPPGTTSNLADGPGGRDNSFGAALYASGSMYSARVNQASDTGTSTLVLRIRGYNGADSDDRVDVAVFGAHFVPAPGRPQPLWTDGKDVWNALEPWVPDGAASPDAAAFHDPDGYVAHGVVVAHLPLLRVGGMPILPLTQVIIAATLQRGADGGWALQSGTIAGRLALTDLLAVSRDAAGRPICDPLTYADFKQGVCQYADINASGLDNRGAPCDAMSWGWQFSQTYPVTLGGVDPFPVVNPCDGGAPPAGDMCASRDF